MIISRSAVAVLLLVLSSAWAAGAEAIKIWIPAGAGGAAKEKTNKDTVVGGWLQDPGKAHWQQFMVPEFINHDPDETRVGAQALVDLMNRGRGAGTIGAAVAPGAMARPRFMVIADGDYVAVAHNPQNFDPNKPTPGMDPGAALGGNVFHVVDGKITEWWFYASSGGPGGGAAAPQPGADQIDVAKNSTRPAVFGNTPLVYGPGPLDDKTEAANKRLVLAWLEDFWVNQNYGAWNQYLSADFRNHDPRQPAQGAQALADWARAHPEFQSGYALGKGAPHPLLFVLAEGDLVFVLGSPEVNDRFDPGAQIASMTGNVLRVERGRIVESWRAGSTRTIRAATPAPVANRGSTP